MLDATSEGAMSGPKTVCTTKVGSTVIGSATASAIRIASAIRPSSSEATWPSLRGNVRYLPVSSVDTSTAGGCDDEVADGAPVAPSWPHAASSAAEIPAIAAIRDISPNIAHSPHSDFRTAYCARLHSGAFRNQWSYTSCPVVPLFPLATTE